MNSACEGDMTCHAVLWIPTIVYQGFAEAKQSSIEKDISDIPGKGNFVRVSLGDHGDVQVSIKSGKGEYEPLVTLIREDVSSNGLISFTYKSTTDKECGFRFTTKEFPTAIYHIIKGFYHRHEFHDGENDSSLAPFVASHRVNIKSDDNEALQHYLKAYGNVIANYTEYIQLLIRRTRSTKDNIEPKTREMLSGMCMTVRGYEAYMGVLYRSKYNTQCRPDNKGNRELRHIACNIENGIRYIKLIEREFGEYTQQSFVNRMIKDAESSLHSSKLSLWVGVGSIALGLVSLVVSFIISAHSTQELNLVKQALQHQLDSIPVLMQESIARDQELSLRQESISATQKGLDAKIDRIEQRLNTIIRNQGK